MWEGKAERSKKGLGSVEAKNTAAVAMGDCRRDITLRPSRKKKMDEVGLPFASSLLFLSLSLYQVFLSLWGEFTLNSWICRRSSMAGCAPDFFSAKGRLTSSMNNTQSFPDGGPSFREPRKKKKREKKIQERKRRRRRRKDKKHQGNGKHRKIRRNKRKARDRRCQNSVEERKNVRCVLSTKRKEWGWSVGEDEDSSCGVYIHVGRVFVIGQFSSVERKKRKEENNNNNSPLGSRERGIHRRSPSRDKACRYIRRHTYAGLDKSQDPHVKKREKPRKRGRSGSEAKSKADKLRADSSRGTNFQKPFDSRWQPPAYTCTYTALMLYMHSQPGRQDTRDPGAIQR